MLSGSLYVCAINKANLECDKYSVTVLIQAELAVPSLEMKMSLTDCIHFQRKFVKRIWYFINEEWWLYSTDLKGS